MRGVLRIIGCGTVLFAFLGLSSGCDVFKSEKRKVEEVLRDGIKEKLGKTVDSIDIRPEGGGKYVGTAQVEGEPFDVTATVEGNAIRWEAREQFTPPKVEKASRQVIQQHLPGELQDFKIAQESKDKYTGSFSYLGRPYKFTSTIVGNSVQCAFQPVIP
jgi:hypothetical protein